MTKAKSIQACGHCNGKGITKKMNICPDCKGYGYNLVEREDEENNTAAVMETDIITPSIPEKFR